VRRYIGFAGKAGAGKNYVADIIENDLWKREVTAEQIGFAGAVRREIEDVLGAYIPRLYEKPTPYEIRRLLQWWGTDFRRAEDPDHWVKRGMERAEDSVCDVVLFTDVRFRNETEAIRDRGGYVVLVTASEQARVRRIGVTPEHASEVVDFDFDFTIENSKDGVLPVVPPELFSYLVTGEKGEST